MTKYKPGKHINFNREERKRKIYACIVVLFALYGFGELVLKSNGF